MRKASILIIDNSFRMRAAMRQALSKYPGVVVVGTAPDVYSGRDLIVKLRPDLVTLDIDLPGMNGIEFLKRLMPQYPIPVIIVSSLRKNGWEKIRAALDAGAVDFVSKPSGDSPVEFNELVARLAGKIRTVINRQLNSAQKNRSHIPGKIAACGSSIKLVAIGASTGGTEAIKRVVASFPRSMPGVLIVQHMPPGFTKMFAEKLNRICRMEVKEAEHGDTIMRGRILIAPGDRHITVLRCGTMLKVLCKDGEKVNGHRPSVDIMMNSVAKSVGKNALGIILTGMGADGAAGILEMKKQGAKTFAQDEKTSVVYGMPKAAVENGAADHVLPLDRIASRVIKEAGEG